MPHHNSQDTKQASTNVQALDSNNSWEVRQTFTNEEIRNAFDQQKHLKRVRIARASQHILTSAISIVVAALQARLFFIYQQTKTYPNCWPKYPNLLPTLMLMVTAFVSLFIDVCALIAYAWPGSGAGRRAFKLADSANGVSKTFKALSYAYSSVVGNVTKIQSTQSGQMNDLWSWTCSDQVTSVEQLIAASSNCIAMFATSALSIANIVVEVVGFCIDRWIARGEKKYKNVKNVPADILELRSAKQGSKAKGKYQRLSDADYAKLDTLQTGYATTLGQDNKNFVHSAQQ